MATKVPGMEVDPEYIQRLTDATKGLPSPEQIKAMDPKEAALARKARKDALKGKASASASRLSTPAGKWKALRVSTSWLSSGKKP